jgi:hypothetical protein
VKALHLLIERIEPRKGSRKAMTEDGFGRFAPSAAPSPNGRYLRIAVMQTESS